MLKIVRNDFSESPWMECMLRIVWNNSSAFFIIHYAASVRSAQVQDVEAHRGVHASPQIPHNAAMLEYFYPG